MLKDIFQAPGRFILSLVTGTRKKYRYASKTTHTGLIAFLSFLVWLAGIAVAFTFVIFLGPSINPPEPVPAPVVQTSGDTSVPSENSGQAPAGTEVLAGNNGGLSVPLAPATPPEVWLVIVESIPKASRLEAEQALVRYKKKGLSLELVDTDAYPLLKSGMWTLALGPYDSRKEAELAAQGLKSKVRDFMVRRGL